MGRRGCKRVFPREEEPKPQVTERVAQTTLRVRQDRILTAKAHTAARRADTKNQVRGDEERWPTMGEIRTTQENADEDLMQAYDLELRDGVLTDSNNHILYQRYRSTYVRD